MHIRSTVAAVTGSGGVALSAATIAASANAGFYARVHAIVNPAALGVLSVACAWLFFASARGYRRLPFLVAAVGGSTVVLATLGLGFGSRGPVVLEQTVSLAAGYLGLVAAGAFMRSPVLPRRAAVRSVLVVFVCGVGAAFALGVGRAGADAGGSGPGAAQRLAYEGEIGDLVRRLDPRYVRYRGALDPVLEELAHDESITEDETEAVIQELNERIRTLESEVARFDRVQEERERYAAEVARLQGALQEVENRAEANADDIQRVLSYEEAVRPAIPLVRDLAAGIAAEHAGSFYATAHNEYPGESGIRQVIAIHRYAMGRWRYVNDPLYIRSDYHSPPERTIAAGFVGDCDDFAVLMASMVEAVGGTVRILHGECDGGAHAWAEVLIGDARSRSALEPVLEQAFPGRRMQFLPADQRGEYWLSLDWELGLYSCGERPQLHYVSGGSGV